MSSTTTRSNFRMRYKGLCKSHCFMPTSCPHIDVCFRVIIQNEILDNNLERVLFNFKLVSDEKH